MSIRRVVLVCAALAAALAGCGDSGSDIASPGSGVRGRALVDGGCPVLTAEKPCPSRPVSAQIVASVKGYEDPAATVTSDADGHYELRLPPGTYVVSGRAGDGRPFPFAKPVEVTVRDGAFTWLRVSFDSGIR